MAIILKAPDSPNVLHPRVPPIPPNFKALLIGISYLFYARSSDARSRPTPLLCVGGPLNDTKMMKTALIGGLINNVDSTAFSPLSRSPS